jgi:hypothetical protein
MRYVNFPTMSPDKKWIYYTYWLLPQTDIYLVENFYSRSTAIGEKICS